MLNPDTRETVKTIIKDGKDIDRKEYRDIHIQMWVVGLSIIPNHFSQRYS